MNKPILKNGVRILRPKEYETIRKHIIVSDRNPQQGRERKIILDTLLLTGMRYIEVQRFQNHPQWFDPDDRYIHIPKEKKEKRRMKDRYVHLSLLGAERVEKFTTISLTLPNRSVWRRNLRRWADYADLDTKGLCAKTTRKTWESWLVRTTEMWNHIVMSQGHTTTTAMDHYVNVPFSDEDLNDMKKYITGWMNFNI